MAKKKLALPLVRARKSEDLGISLSRLGRPLQLVEATHPGVTDVADTDIRTLAAILRRSKLQMVLRFPNLFDDHKLKAIDRIEQLGR
jgi:hypothetical protein